LLPNDFFLDVAKFDTLSIEHSWFGTAKASTRNGQKQSTLSATVQANDDDKPTTVGRGRHACWDGFEQERRICA